MFCHNGAAVRQLRAAMSTETDQSDVCTSKMPCTSNPRSQHLQLHRIRRCIAVACKNSQFCACHTPECVQPYTRTHLRVSHTNHMQSCVSVCHRLESQHKSRYHDRVLLFTMSFVECNDCKRMNVGFAFVVRRLPPPGELQHGAAHVAHEARPHTHTHFARAPQTTPFAFLVS